MADEGDLLVLLIDLQLFHLPEHDAFGAALPPDIVLQQVLIFINSYLLLHDHNQLAIFAVHGAGCDVVFQSFSGDQGAAAGSGNHPARAVQASTLALLERAAAEQPGSSNAAVSSQMKLSGALSRALCLINRLKAAAPARLTGLLARPRILCLVASPDSPMQYIPVMNTIFSAQRAEVFIDACVVLPSDSTFLQQATHLTGGVYVRPSAATAGALLQHLLLLLLPDTATRRTLRLQQEALGVDFRAACFCHKRTIDLGHVCSVCLSIFCQRTPACTTCGAAFVGKKAAGQAVVKGLMGA